MSHAFDGRRALGWLRGLLAGVGLMVAIFLLLPIGIIFPMALSKDAFLTWPPDLLSLRWFDAFFEQQVWTDALWQSVKISVPVAATATVLGTLAAVGVHHARRLRRTLQLLFIMPLVLPLVTYALGLYDVAWRVGADGTIWPVIVGQTMLATPLVFVTVSTGLANSDRLLPMAAASLGAPPRVVLWRIELSLQRPAIATGAVVALAYSFDEIIVAYFLLPPGVGTLPVQILASTRESADATVAAASVVVMGIAASLAAAFAVARLLLMRRNA